MHSSYFKELSKKHTQENRKTIKKLENHRSSPPEININDIKFFSSKELTKTLSLEDKAQNKCCHFFT